MEIRFLSSGFFSRGEDAAQMPDFVIHFRWIGDGFGDFIAEEAAVTLA